MQVDIIPIGNSRGIRIPKALLKECGFGVRAELTIENRKLVLNPESVRPGKKLREGWAESAKRMAANGDDVLIETPPTKFDQEEWEW